MWNSKENPKNMLQQQGKNSSAHVVYNRAHNRPALKREVTMSTRAYVLINSVEGKAPEVLTTLRGKPGIKFMDYLEGPPDIIVILQACTRQKLAELTNHVLYLVESLIENFQVLPTKNGFE